MYAELLLNTKVVLCDVCILNSSNTKAKNATKKKHNKILGLKLQQQQKFQIVL